MGFGHWQPSESTTIFSASDPRVVTEPSAVASPAVGVVHGGDRSDGSLVFDLIEELRAPMVDRRVWALVGRGWKPATHRGATRTVLTVRSRRVLARAHRRQRSRSVRRGRSVTTWGELPWLQARAFRDFVIGETDRYAPFHFRW